MMIKAKDWGKKNGQKENKNFKDRIRKVSDNELFGRATGGFTEGAAFAIGSIVLKSGINAARKMITKI